MRESLAKYILIIYVSLFAMHALAQKTQIQVFGLFKDRAVVEINGQQKILRVGKATQEGIKLIRASSSKAVIEVDGEVREYTLGSNVSTSLKEPEASVVRIPSMSDGQYHVSGQINGGSVNFLVDTGAGVVAMNRQTADRLQIDYRLKGVPTAVSTAANINRAWAIKLASVSIGEITLHNVDAVVTDTQHQLPVLLGMSFLSRLKVTQEESMMVLEKKR